MSQTPIRSGQIDTGTTDGQMAIVEAGDTLNASVIPSGAAGNQVAVSMGNLANGAMIPLPAGYTEGQCKWVASQRGSITDTNGGVAKFTCSSTGTRTVTSLYYDANTGGSHAVQANYLIIGIK